MLAINASGFFPYTPATNLLFGLREALAMLNEEGLANVFARHIGGSPRPRARRCAPGDSRSCASAPTSTARWSRP